MISLEDGDQARSAGPDLLEVMESRQQVLDRRRRQARELARRRRRAQIRRNRVIACVIVLAFGFVMWNTLGSSAAAPDRPGVRPKAILTAALRTVRTVPGRLGAFPWPAKGQGAVAVLGEGVMSHSATNPVVPIASLTKMMTAYLVLKDHPLGAGAEGPTFVMDQADVAGYVHADQTDESNVPVQLGEHLTEHQLLEALLIPSADNVADFLANWDGGSEAAFVVKMNATARLLGMHHTHYADASGVNPSSRSNATDQAVLAAQLMQSPVVRGIVSKSSLAFPVAGTIWNYNPGLGTDGVIGVKSGFTSRAQGCLATAAYRTAGGTHVLVIAVALGQTGGLGEAAHVDEGLLDAAGRSLVAYHVPLPVDSVATVALGGSTTSLFASGTSPLIVGWPGMKVHERVVSRALSSGTANSVLADLVLSSSVGVIGSIPLTATDAAASTATTLPVNSLPATSLPASTLPASS